MGLINMVDHPGELSDTLERFIFANQMENGRTYAGRNHVGEFKKVEDVVYFKSVMADAEWIVVEPHEKSLFRPIGFVQESDEEAEAHELNTKLQHITKQIAEGYTEGYYPHWQLIRTITGWEIKFPRERM
jgi:hypothetical protein